MNPGHIDLDENIEVAFARHGMVCLRNAVDMSPGSRMHKFFRWTLEQSGLLAGETLACPAGLTSLPPTRVADMEVIAPRLWEAVTRLLGGAEMVRQPARISNALICNYRTTALPQAWHVDGDFFVHYPDSGEQALLIFILWSDVSAGEGATEIAPGATSSVLHLLADAPGGLTTAQLPIGRLVARTDERMALTGNAGDAWILHPLTAHQSAPNPAGDPRFISNPAVSLREPMRLTQVSGESALEEYTRKQLGGPYTPARDARRRTFTPARIRRWRDEGVYTDDDSRQPA